tara:strand:- start:232 stop:537 length:306 start_codon:yes stop_codon:yes gene_type:complete
MLLDLGFSEGGNINDLGISVETTHNRGSTAEELAIRCANKIVGISETAHPTIRAQAEAFRTQVARVVELSLSQSIKSDRTTVYNVLTTAGHPELVDLLRRI